MSESEAYPYATHLNVQFPALSLVDVPALVDACTHHWYNQTLCKVNDSVVRLGVLQGEYHWHKHDHDDEFFFVLEGHFIIDLEGRSIDLQPQQGFVVPRGIMVIGTVLSLGNGTTVALSVVLAFVSGYLLTMLPLLRTGMRAKQRSNPGGVITM